MKIIYSLDLETKSKKHREREGDWKSIFNVIFAKNVVYDPAYITKL